MFSNDDFWVITFEKSGFGNRSGECEIMIDYLGTGLVNQPNSNENNGFITNTRYVHLIHSEFKRIEDGFELVSKKASDIVIRNQKLPIEQDISKYKTLGIEIQSFDNPKQQIDFVSLVRFLNEKHKEVFYATEEELRFFIPESIPRIMTIDEWHHTTIAEYGGNKPSENETFQMIADILATKDKSLWKPQLKPNNHWRNWPKAGGL